MDAATATEYIAQGEARRGLRPLTDEAELGALAEAGRALPVLRIQRDAATGRLHASGHGHQGHDNEGRMPFLLDFFNARVLPYVDPAVDVRGAWRVELHDSHSYLPRAAADPAAYHNAMVFARPRRRWPRVASLLPDPYQMGGYGGLLDLAAKDNVAWEAKKPVLFFAGTTTGDRDPARNERIAACRWALQQPRHVADFRITNVAQMTLEDCRRAVPGFDGLLHPPVPPQEHFPFRYQVNLAGNTACWSRVPMVMASKSLLVHLRTHDDILWYYPLLREDVHYAAVGDLHAMPAKRQWLEANPQWCKRVVEDANRFVTQHLTPLNAAQYTIRLLEDAADAGRA